MLSFRTHAPAPAVDSTGLEATANAVAAARRNRNAAEEAYNAARSHSRQIADRLANLDRRRREILNRRATGDERQGDAEEVALLVQDAARLSEIHAEAIANEKHAQEAHQGAVSAASAAERYHAQVTNAIAAFELRERLKGIETSLVEGLKTLHGLHRSTVDPQGRAIAAAEIYSLGDDLMRLANNGTFPQ